ncbi:MAG: hypothetical protein CMN04_09155 [Roseibacillus sp.]|nr:hypothetical protein [Roseibacillus sp.]|tara:strand:- start:18153 stop:19922 length:1770 start_codon:yes stop_codon:yes gene_type:complete
MRTCFLALLLCLLPAKLPGEAYIGPDPAPILFRRDLVPIDTDTMRELSGYLTDLATREPDGTPEQTRATAQLLALAIRLNPANRSALETDKTLRAGQAVDSFEGDINQPLRQAWGIADWLLDPASGAGGKALGNLVVDALAVINPQNPLVRLQDPEGELERWKHVVPTLEAYQRPPEQKTPPPPVAPPPPPVERPPILLGQASTKTPLFLLDRDRRRSLRLVPLSMKVMELPQGDILTFSLEPKTESPDIASARVNVRKVLEQRWPDLPIGRIAQLSTGIDRYAPNNGQAISGPAALLIHSSLTGRPLRPGVTLVAEVASDGSLTRPLQSWSYLRALRLAPGGRLLVAPDFEPELRAMIALEDPAFFLRWEVLIVSSIDTALNLASENSDPAGLAATSQLYEELRDVGRDKDVGQLCVNAKVRERLSEITSRVPFHYSAKMLLVQGDATLRPTRVEREVAGRILRSALEPVGRISQLPLSQLSAKRLLTAGETTSAEIERFSKFISPADKDLLQEAQEVAQLTQILGKGKQDGGLRDGVTYFRNTPLPAYQSRLRSKFAALRQKLAPFTRESVQPALPDDPPPAADPSP